MRSLRTACLAAALAAGGCDGAIEPSPLDPVIEPDIVPQADGFSLRAAGLAGVSQRVTHTWPHAGAVAVVTQSSTLEAGTATLSVRDGAGNTIYVRSLAERGSFTTSRGTPGAWAIVVETSAVSGTIAFAMQSAGPAIPIDGDRYPPGLPEGPIF